MGASAWNSIFFFFLTLSPFEAQREALENCALSINDPVSLTGRMESISHKRVGKSEEDRCLVELLLRGTQWGTSFPVSLARV